MKYIISVPYLVVSLLIVPGCKSNGTQEMAPAPAMTQAELSALANTVPNTGPREGNNYKAFFLVLRQNQSPAVGFQVEAYVKGKSEPKIVRTNEQGLATFEDLPFPGMKNPLVGVFHYYKGSEDQPRDITYPFIQSDAYRLKDVQYIPNMVTSDPA